MILSPTESLDKVGVNNAVAIEEGELLEVKSFIFGVLKESLAT